MFTNLTKIKFIKFGKHSQFLITSYHHIGPRGDMWAALALILNLKFYSKINSPRVYPFTELVRAKVSTSPVSERTDCHAQTSGKY